MSDDVAPDLVVTALTVPATASAGSVIAISATTKNQGTGASSASTTRFYLSANTGIEASDPVVGSSAVGTLGVGASAAASLNVTIPGDTAPGTYFLIAQADAENTNAETSEANNIRSVAFRIGPDLTISAISGPGIAAGGATVTIAETTKNGGGGAAGATVTRFYFSTDTTIDASDQMIGVRNVPALAANATSAGSTSVTIPASASTGSYYIIARADADNAVVETVETNNNGQTTLKIGPDLVDLGCERERDVWSRRADHDRRHDEEPGRQRQRSVGDAVLLCRRTPHWTPATRRSGRGTSQAWRPAPRALARRP